MLKSGTGPDPAMPHQALSRSIYSAHPEPQPSPSPLSEFAPANPLRAIQSCLAGNSELSFLIAENLPPAERMRQCAAIDEFKLSAERHPMRETRRANFRVARELAEQMCSCLAFDRGIGRDTQLAHLTLGQACGEQIEAELLRPHAIERRKATEQHKIVSAKASRLFDRELVDRRFDHTQ